ncbi:helix-turn-helix domain-containing protein [Seleniivibrio woodruffii]
MRRHDIDPRTAAREYFNGQFSYAGNFPTLREMEAMLIASAIDSVKGNISAAAKILGITRQALHKQLKNRLR